MALLSGHGVGNECICSTKRGNLHAGNDCQQDRRGQSRQSNPSSLVYFHAASVKPSMRHVTVPIRKLAQMLNADTTQEAWSTWSSYRYEINGARSCRGLLLMHMYITLCSNALPGPAAYICTCCRPKQIQHVDITN